MLKNKQLVSATSALEATQVGYRVGTRNVVDLLQAEKNLYSVLKKISLTQNMIIFLPILRLGL